MGDRKILEYQHGPATHGGGERNGNYNSLYVHGADANASKEFLAILVQSRCHCVGGRP